MERKVQEMNLIWKYTHPDYRGKLNGVRYVLINDRMTGATISIPLQSLTKAEHETMLAFARRREACGHRGW